MPDEDKEDQALKNAASKYIDETGKAVQQLFDGLAFYRRILEEDPRPIFIKEVSPGDKNARNCEFEEWYRENQADIQTSLEKQREYLGYTFSQATLSGSILQIACMAVSLFSNNDEIPESCSSFIAGKSKNVKFCIGRIVNTLPIGIIILAARNQYNHWDDPKPRKLTVDVFDRLANVSGKYTDPAFDLNNSTLQTYSHNVLSLLEWKDYSAYLKDIKALLY